MRMYIEVNFSPSKYALDFVFFPKIMEDNRIDIMGIRIFIAFVGNI